MEAVDNLEIGQVVISKAGRDTGRMFIVIDKVDEQYVLLVDGQLRRVDAPKKKKIKHIAKTNKISEFVRKKIDSGERITNIMIRKELEKIQSV